MPGRPAGGEAFLPLLGSRLARVRASLHGLGRRVRSLQRARARLEERARQLARQLSHLLQVCPVDPPRTFIDDFGVLSHRDTAPHRHMGIDVFAPAGTPIRAPFAGVAEDATNAVGGLGVEGFGPHGFVYNAYLSALGKLGPVRAGDVVGFVGATGNARGTHLHDHFEWHSGGGEAVDPYPALVEACGP